MTQAKMSRRKFLGLAGGSIAVLAVGGVAYRAVDQGLFSTGRGSAYAPWINWQDAETAPERIIAAGILAANPHNSQPWLFRISAATIDLYAGPSRQIGVIDPFRREMTIGLGCVLENIALAAAAEGFAADVQLMPDPADETHAARLELIPTTALASELYAAIPARHTDRSAYDTARPVADGTLAAINGLVTDPDVRLFWFADAASRAAFGEIAIAATEALTPGADTMHRCPYCRPTYAHQYQY